MRTARGPGARSAGRLHACSPAVSAQPGRIHPGVISNSCTTMTLPQPCTEGNLGPRATACHGLHTAHSIKARRQQSERVRLAVSAHGWEGARALCSRAALGGGGRGAGQLHELAARLGLHQAVHVVVAAVVPDACIGTHKGHHTISPLIKRSIPFQREERQLKYILCIICSIFLRS